METPSSQLFSDVLCSVAISVRYRGPLHQQEPQEMGCVHFQLVGGFPRLEYIFKSTLHHTDGQQTGKASVLYFLSRPFFPHWLFAFSMQISSLARPALSIFIRISMPITSVKNRLLYWLVVKDFDHFQIILHISWLSKTFKYAFPQTQSFIKMH